ncbi:MAG TPA: Fe-S cluster assembly protein HesB [Actinomycetota bacterium]|nr:Fe-S cluster assembly protein HesB [Actinomycetota bacterium]
MSTKLRLALRGPGGEPVDLWRTIVSHGVASLPPMFVDEEERVLEVTLKAGRATRTVRVRETSGAASVEILGPQLSERGRTEVRDAVAHILRLDEDLSDFYSKAATDPDLAWASAGAGRMVRSPTVFEEIVKTICTTNCTWSATERMVGAIVEHLGDRAPNAPASGTRGRAFPTPEAVAAAGERFYKEVARAGYRGAYIVSLAESVAEGRMDPEELTAPDLPEEEVRDRLLALPGVGPYAAAHIMMMLGRYSSLILDSWTRPKYARLKGRKSVDDATILRKFKRYGNYAGLAFWLFLTRDWVEE